MKTLNENSGININPSRTLSIGQRAVLNAYLAAFEPAEVYDPELDILYPTDAIVLDLDGAAHLNLNGVADHLANLGYRYHYIHEHSVSGWIFRPIASEDIEDVDAIDTDPERKEASYPELIFD